MNKADFNNPAVLRAMHRPRTLVQCTCDHIQRATGKHQEFCAFSGRPAIAGPQTLAKAALPPKQADTPRPEKRIVLNRTEQRMLDLLKYREQKGEIRDVRVMPMSLKWGLDEQMHYMTYSPDFSYISDAVVTLVEVKGAHIRDRDIARFKGCRADWPGVNFVMWQWKGGTWTQIY